MAQETHRAVLPQFQSSSYISYVLPYPESCAKHVAEIFDASRVYVLASGLLSRKTDAVDHLNAALDRKIGKGTVVGVIKGIRPHTHCSDVLKTAREAQELKADCLVTPGAGSLIDAANFVTLDLANNATILEELETLHSDSASFPDHILPVTAPKICIPTSLSAGENTALEE